METITRLSKLVRPIGGLCGERPNAIEEVDDANQKGTARRANCMDNDDATSYFMHVSREQQMDIALL
eukprot:scaffold177259_cov17-Tisochrysis_lutea.AAC.1